MITPDGPLECESAAYVYLVFNSLIAMECVLTLVINRQEPRLRARSSSIFANSLAVSNALLSFTSSGFKIWSLTNKCENPMSLPKCIFLSVCVRYFYVISGLSVNCLSMDRYLYLCWPLHYPLLITRRRCRCVVVACWLLPVTIIVLPTAIDQQLPCADSVATDTFVYTYVVMYSAVALSTFIMYLLVALEFRKQCRVQRFNQDMAKSDRLVKARTAKSAVSFLALYAVMSLPHMVLLSIYRASEESMESVMDYAYLMHRIRLLLFLPVYAWANAIFRSALVARMRRAWRFLTCRGDGISVFQLHLEKAGEKVRGRTETGGTAVTTP